MSEGQYNFLDKIQNQNDLKKLDANNLNELAAEIREFLISSVSKTGGHLASNLGVVELTLAIHKIFDLKIDKLIWDVGHQSYVHKILTGRKNRFNTLRQSGGLSGFPKTEESEFDFFNTGHSSTSISAALGFAKGIELLGQSGKTVAVIGDAAITGGMAFEALNHAGSTNSDIIIVLNDNGMSISKNVGAISSLLSFVRTNQAYSKIKDEVTHALGKIPVVGQRLNDGVYNLKARIKKFLLAEKIFQNFGFAYMGPVDGHDIEELLLILNKAKSKNGPILVHVHTQKGRGYCYAEKQPEFFHGIGKFEPHTGDLKCTSKIPAKETNEVKLDNNEAKLREFSIVKESYSKVFGHTLCELASNDEKIVAITAAMTDGTGLLEFSKKFKKRFFDVGIAEQHAVTFACGLAKMNFVPIVAIYSSFLQRAYDQILHDAALQKLHIIFCVDRAGVVGEDGETHQGIYDMSFLLPIPNISILCPSSKENFIFMLKNAIYNFKTPVFIRYPREKSLSFKNDQGLLKFPENLTSYVIYRNSIEPEVVIIGAGNMVSTAIAIAKEIEKFNIKSVVVDIQIIKPLDIGFLKKITKRCVNIIIIEDGVEIGGCGSLIESVIHKKVYKFAYPDEPILHGTAKEIYEKYRITVKNISEFIIKLSKKEIVINF